MKLTKNYTIPCYDTDASWRLKPASFMNLAQEAANNHATILGFGYDDLIKSRTAWILSRVHVEFLSTPKWRDEIVFSTWHKGLNRIFFLRDFLVTDKDGKELIKATSSWLVLNLDTRRLVRSPELMEEGTVCGEDAVEQPADKVVMPKELQEEFVMTHSVGYSDVDMLGHANNAMYMQWAMDAVDYDIASSRRVRNLTINFNHETRAGDKVSLFRAVSNREDGLRVFVEGRKVDDVSSFCVEIVFE